MIRIVFSICLSVHIISVASNPVIQVPTQQCPICPQAPNKNPPSVPYQQTIQNNPNAHQYTVENQTPPRTQNYEGLNQSWLNKILGNQCLQKILDPNTKLFNQNGQEIQRQPKTSAPSIVNNYFILSPEFFYDNNTKSDDAPKYAGRRRKVNGSRRANISKVNTTKDVDSTKPQERNKTRKSGISKKGNKRRNQVNSSAKMIAEDVDMENKEGGYEEKTEIKNITPRKKQNIREKGNISTNHSNIKDPEEQSESGKETLESNKNKKRKRKQQTKQKKQNADNEGFDKILTDIQESTDTQDVPLTNKKSSLRPEVKELSKDGTRHIPHLKDIELPSDNRESIKDSPENRSTRNSKSDKRRKQQQQNFNPTYDDILKSFYPYMYLNNYFYPNNNFPFNFEQFFYPNFFQGNKNHKKRKNRKNKNEQNNNELRPNVLEVKLKQKKPEVVTENAVKLENSTEDIIIEAQQDTQSIEITETSPEPITDIPMVIPHKTSPVPVQEPSLEAMEVSVPEVIPTEIPEEITPNEEFERELEPEILQTEPVETNAKLVMPISEVIEDLHKYMTPEIEREDIVPVIYNNGIINDYYPIFYDDFFYSSDESYNLKDVEDERLFYTTDRGQEEQFNRDRRKYDSSYHISNNIKDRINFRRGFINRERDRINNADVEENVIPRPLTHEKIVKEKSKTTETQQEDPHFQPPFMLENPDFETKEIGKKSLQSFIYDKDSGHSNDELSNQPSPQLPEFVGTAAGDLNTFHSTNQQNTDQNHDLVETVFAKSRVVKYGIPKQSEEIISSSHKEDGSIFFGDGQTSYVVAKSLGSIDDYW